MDALIWTYNPASFIPHEIWGGQPEAPHCDVLIGTQAPPDSHHQVLINLATETPEFFSSFERLLEIVDPAHPEPSRQRYQYYKDRGYPLETHKI